MKLLSRNDFPHLLNEMGLTGEAAEIGVCQGRFSWWILSNWKGKKLYSIDSWQYQGRKLDKSDVSQEEHDKNFNMTKLMLKEFGSRSQIIRKFARVAHLDIPVASLDFVHLDARHDFRGFYDDLSIWWGMVKEGGVISGHDYKNSFVRKNLVEVKRVVDNFFAATGHKIYSTTEDNIPSWYVIK